MFSDGRCRAVLKAENFQLSKLHNSDQTKIKITNQSKKRKFSECIFFFFKWTHYVFTKPRKCVLWKSITERDTILFLNILSSVPRARGLWKPRFRNYFCNFIFNVIRNTLKLIIKSHYFFDRLLLDKFTLGVDIRV